MTAAALPVWRSLLFVPVTAKRFVDGAARRGADAIILDLEDSVAASEKERARAPVPEAAEIVSRGGADVVVRINRPLRLAVRDIETAVGPGVLALALPKVDSPEHVRLLAEIVDEVEAERGMALGHDPPHRDGRDRRGLLPYCRDRPRSSTALRPQSRRRRFPTCRSSSALVCCSSAKQRLPPVKPGCGRALSQSPERHGLPSPASPRSAPSPAVRARGYPLSALSSSPARRERGDQARQGLVGEGIA